MIAVAPLTGTMLQQLLQLAINAPSAALALLPASLRGVVNTLTTGIPDLRRRLAAQWDEVNNAIEADYTGVPQDQMATIVARVNEKRALLVQADADMRTIDEVLAAAAGVLAGMGYTLPPWPFAPRSLNGLGGPLVVIGGAAVIIIALGIGGGYFYEAWARGQRSVAAAERIRLGTADVDPASMDVGTAAVGVAGLLVAGLLLVFVMGRRS